MVVLGLELGLTAAGRRGAHGDGWTRGAESDNEVTLAAYEQAAERFRESIPHGPNEALIELFG